MSRSRSRRRHKKKNRLGKILVKAIKWLSLPLAACLVAVFYSNHIINKAAEGKTFTDPSALPHHTTALLLGTNPKAKSGRPNSFYIQRIDAAVKLYEAGKYDRLILSGAGDEEGTEHVERPGERSGLSNGSDSGGGAPDPLYDRARNSLRSTGTDGKDLDEHGPV